MEYNSDIGEPGTAAAIEYDPDLAWVLEDIQRDLEIQQLLDDSVPADNGLGYQNTDWDWNTPGFGSTWTIDEWFNVIFLPQPDPYQIAEQSTYTQHEATNQLDTETYTSDTMVFTRSQASTEVPSQPIHITTPTTTPSRDANIPFYTAATPTPGPRTAVPALHPATPESIGTGTPPPPYVYTSRPLRPLLPAGPIPPPIYRTYPAIPAGLTKRTMIGIVGLELGVKWKNHTPAQQFHAIDTAKQTWWPQAEDRWIEKKLREHLAAVTSDDGKKRRKEEEMRRVIRLFSDKLKEHVAKKRQEIAEQEEAEKEIKAKGEGKKRKWEEGEGKRKKVKIETIKEEEDEDEVDEEQDDEQEDEDAIGVTDKEANESDDDPQSEDSG
ncbi:Protein of unknown function [Pyronema omphalodes CBS 100304]|uniref:Uncharacterized protein n=1 Tax=Pyronema omphalodes (strain CBS 100304) TaxID=1076935 RepID=U4L9R9_PYROM|nr:Protein of unknown function [Pyronema omphalodes CBS 100304]